MTLAEWFRCGIQVLVGDAGSRPHKGELAAKPLVDHHGERILITGGGRLALDLLGSHIGQRAELSSDLHRLCTRSEQGQAKITEQYLVLGPQQHVFRLEITVDEVLIMSML